MCMALPILQNTLNMCTSVIVSDRLSMLYREMEHGVVKLTFTLKTVLKLCLIPKGKVMLEFDSKPITADKPKYKTLDQT